MRAREAGARRARAINTILALAVATTALVYSWSEGKLVAGLDFYQFWAGAQVARSPATANLYSPLTRATAYDAFVRRAQAESPRMLAIARMRTDFEFFSTPFLYTTFGVFGGRYDRDLFAYRVILLASFVAGVLLLGRAAGLTWAASLMIVAFGLTLFQPAKSDFRVLNVNSLQLLAVAASIRLAGGDDRRRWFAGAALLGVVAMFKPNIAIVVPLLLAYRRRERARLLAEGAGVAAGVGVAFVASSIYFRSPSAWLQWLAAARGLAGTVLSRESGNFAPFANLGTAAPIAATVVLMAVTLYCARRRGQSALVIGMGLLIYLVGATLVWIHYVILALPLAVALLSTRMRWPALLALTLVGGDLWNRTFGITSAIGEAVVCWLGLALLFVLGLRELAAGRDVRPAAP